MLIPIAKIKDDVIFVKAVTEFNRTNYYYINYEGEKSTMYRSLDQAKAHIQELFGEIEGFEMIQEVKTHAAD